MKEYVDVVVCGAHLSGLALNYQLQERDAVLLEATHSSPEYKLYAIAGGPPFRPAMVKVSEGGRSIPVEVWRLSTAAFGDFVSLIPAPLGIGKVNLIGERVECGFIAEPIALQGAVDITHFGGWRNYVASLSQAES